MIKEAFSQITEVASSPTVAVPIVGSSSIAALIGWLPVILNIMSIFYLALLIYGWYKKNKK